MQGNMHRCVAALLVDDGQVLLAHRHPGRRWYPNVWDIPGGHVEPGESDAAALVRELREELGITVTVPEGPPARRFRIDGAEPVDMAIWIVDNWSGNLNNCAPDEHDELRWCPPECISDLDLAHPSYQSLIADALSGGQDFKHTQNG